jgi:hypothetical protein
MTPCFFKVYGEHSSYAEAALLNPADMGWVRIWLDRNGTIPAIDLVNEDGKVIEHREPKVIG